MTSPAANDLVIVTARLTEVAASDVSAAFTADTKTSAICTFFV